MDVFRTFSARVRHMRLKYPDKDFLKTLRTGVRDGLKEQNIG